MKNEVLEKEITRIDDIIKKVENRGEHDIFTPRIFYTLTNAEVDELKDILGNYRRILNDMEERL